MLGILRSILVQPLGETYCQTSSRGHTPVQTVGRHAHVAPMSYFGVRQFFSTSRVEEVTQSLLNQLEEKTSHLWSGGRRTCSYGSVAYYVL